SCEGAHHTVPSPLVGEGQGEGWRRSTERDRSQHRRERVGCTFVQAQIRNRCSACSTPLPVPPPQGGREPCGSDLRNFSAAKFEMCAFPSACAGTTAGNA